MNVTKNQAEIEVILPNHPVKKSGYGDTGYARLVRANGSVYLIVDEWCGGAIEGQCFREFVYQIDDSDVPAAVEAIKTNEFQEWYLGLAEWKLTTCGRRANFKILAAA